MRDYNLLTIDLQKIAQNIHIIRKLLPPHMRIMPMVKAQGYGTDASRLAHFYQKLGIDIVGVSHIHEALELRNSGVSYPIFLIHGYEEEAEAIANHQIEVGLSDLSLLKALSCQEKRTKVHLHIDTGMKRFGCGIEEAETFFKAILEEKRLIFEGVMTHFVGAESPRYDVYTKKQILSFERCLHNFKKKAPLPPWIHSQNSSGALRFSPSLCNMVRIGLAPFGYTSPLLHPSLKLESKILNINICRKGESVGYNKSYVASREQERIAIVPFGYNDGIKLNFSGKGYALLHGKKAPFVGKICMDFMMLDVTEIREAKVGDTLLFFGESAQGKLPLETFASFGKTNVREVMTSLGTRVKRIFHE